MSVSDFMLVEGPVDKFEPSMPLLAEPERLTHLYQYEILDTPPEPVFDDIVQLAAQLCDTPVALVSFVDADRQWFKAAVGWSGVETARDISFCTHAIAQPYFFEVSDALLDPRFRDNPLVTGDPHVRFYAAVPLINRANAVVGTLCVIDVQPRQLTLDQQDALWALSRQVMTHLDQRFLLAQHQALQQPQQENLLLKLSSHIRQSLDLDEILATTVQEIQSLFRLDRCGFLWSIPTDASSSLMMSHEACAPGVSSWFTLKADRLNLFSSQVIAQEIIQIDDTHALLKQGLDLYELMRNLDATSLILLPVKSRSGQLGAIACSYSRQPHSWGDKEIEILQAVVDQVAIAIEQAELYASSKATALAAATQAEQLGQVLQNLRTTQAQLIQTEKMSSLGQMVAGIAHEINNPVNFINGNLSYANDYVKDLLRLIGAYQNYCPEPPTEIQEVLDDIDFDFLVEDLQKLLKSMRTGADRIRDIVVSLRNFSRLDEAEMKAVDIHEGLDSTLLILQNRTKEKGADSGVEIIKNYGDLPMVECYASQLNQVFMNLLSNAIDALEGRPAPRQITISTEVLRKADHPRQSMVAIRFLDNGPGIPQKTIRHIFDPFFTTKPIGKGTGLGLSISYQIITDRHGGQLTCTSTPGAGTEFCVQIPLSVGSIQ